MTGRKFLGGFIGKREDIESWPQKKVEQWYTCVQRLAHAAKSFPHEAFTALSKSLQNEWGYILRVTDEAESINIFTSLRDAIKDSFLPSLSSLELDDTEKVLCASQPD